MNTQSKITILRGRQIDERRGKKRSSRYNDIAAGLLTPGVKLSERAVGWPDYEIDAINAARIRGADDDDIRELVKRLIAARKTLALTEGAQ